MSPAEITQQLGLQSLTRRAWVSILQLFANPFVPVQFTDIPSSSNPLALPPVTVCTRVWSGSPTLFGKPTATKRVIITTTGGVCVCSWTERNTKGNLQMMD